MALHAARQDGVYSVLVPDAEIIRARQRLWVDRRIVVEHGAATALAALTCPEQASGTSGPDGAGVTGHRFRPSTGEKVRCALRGPTPMWRPWPTSPTPPDQWAGPASGWRRDPDHLLAARTVAGDGARPASSTEFGQIGQDRSLTEWGTCGRSSVIRRTPLSAVPVMVGRMVRLTPKGRAIALVGAALRPER
jgi:hypothetical protein